MKNRLILAALAAVVFLASCKKEEPTLTLLTVDGYAIDRATGDSVLNVKIRLRRDDQTTPGLGSSLRAFETLVDSTVTDSNGHFTFTVQKQPKRYCYEPIKEGYWYHTGMNVSLLDNPPGETAIVNLYPLTYLKVRIVNESPRQPADSIWYDGPTDASPEYVDDWYFPGIYSHDFGLVGENVDTSFIVTLQYFEAPLQYWDVTENGTTIRSFAYIGCTPFDTCLFEIKY
jgi:hypothetical protein